MAIEQVELNSDSKALNDFMKTLVPDLLSEVGEPDETGNFTCKDLKGNEALEWSATGTPGFTVHTKNGGDVTLTPSGITPYIGMKAKNGAVIRLKGGSDTERYALLITKNTLGNTAFVLSSPNTAGIEANLKIFRCVEYNDRSPLLAQMTLGQVTTEYQTVLVPFVSSGAKDITAPAATEHAFFLPYRQVDTNATMIINGIKYWTNGVWAIEDE